MMRTRSLLLCLALLVAGCRSQAAAAEPTATPPPTVTPTATPQPTPTPDERAREKAVSQTVTALRGTVTPPPDADPDPTPDADPTPDTGARSLAWARQAARDRGGLLFVANAGQRPGVTLMVRAGPGLGRAIVGEVASGDYLVGLAFRPDGQPGCTAGWIFLRDLEPGVGGSSLPAAGGWSCLNYLLDVEGRHAALPAAVPE